MISDKYKVGKSAREYVERFTTDIIDGLESSGIPYINLAPLMRDKFNIQMLYFHRNGNPEHFTPEGNRIVAEILVEEVKNIFNN